MGVVSLCSDAGYDSTFRQNGKYRIFRDNFCSQVTFMCRDHRSNGNRVVESAVCDDSTVLADERTRSSQSVF